MNYLVTRILPAAALCTAMLALALVLLTGQGRTTDATPAPGTEPYRATTATACDPVRLVIGSPEWQGLLSSGRYEVAVPNSDVPVLLPTGCSDTPTQ